MQSNQSGYEDRTEKIRQQIYDLQSADKDACGIGAVVNIDGHKDHKALSDALNIVEKLEHRAGKDASGKVGDGVGILTQISHKFFKKTADSIGIKLAGERDYGVGMFFFFGDDLKTTLSKRMLEVIAEKNGVKFLGWRQVPTHPEILGEVARECMPNIMQCFFERPKGCAKGLEFDQKLYVLRREFEQSADEFTYVCSLSSRTIVYKGMFLVGQLRTFYDDLLDEDYEISIATVHSRFSTNTTPSWMRAHPYRMIVHNGEINTIQGNADRMLAREETMDCAFMEENRDVILPVISDGGSDSAILDNTLEFLYMNGMPLPLILMSMIPEPWRFDENMNREKKEFYHYYATMMEPWDGPAAVACTDGDMFAASLDRNGLRPSRYYVTKDNRLILSSEVGVLEEPPENIAKKSRLQPGKILLVDTKQKRIIADEECKKYYSTRRPYGEWLDMNLLQLRNLNIPNKKVPKASQEERDRLYTVFGYTKEDVHDAIIPMATNGVEATGSMGHDIPIAVLSEKNQPLFYYFKQKFAQVTNPPIDSLREKIVTDTTVYLGSDGNLLDEKPENCKVLEVRNPILTGVDMMKIKALNKPGFKSEVISILYYKNTSLEKALDKVMLAADKAYKNGANILILSDRGVDESHVPIPSLLAVSALEQHLVRTKKRTAVSIVLESGDPRDVHGCAALLGFGARAINPYLAHECIQESIDKGLLDKDYHTAVEDYNDAIRSGIVKIAAKMGISTIQSYQSAKIFEAIGISKDVIDKYFTGTVSRIGGIGLKELEQGVLSRHDHAYDPMGLGVDTTIDSVGFHSMRSGPDKEEHIWRPEAIVTMQQAVREGNYKKFKEYSAMVNDERAFTLRGLLDFKAVNDPVPLEEVESASEIVKRFQTGAMSYGSISQEAHECLAIAMNRLGGKSNTGEGGEAVDRYGTERCSAVKQVASGRFGVTSVYLNNAQEIQIKMAQGAKPGEGGHLPGKKVYPWVADTRFSTPGVSLISPPPHHDIYSIEDLAQLIYDLKNANKNANISVKLVSENGVGTIASGVAKAGAGLILISGYDGGTGAAPLSSIHNAGLPWELGVAETHRNLIQNNLRGRVHLETDGKLMTGRDVAIACLLGAEDFCFATAPLISMGCMMMRACNKDTCPVGIATQNQKLRARFTGKPEHVMNFMLYVAEEVREIMASLGFRTIDEMVGRNDCLKPREEMMTDRAKTVKLDFLLDTTYAHAKENHYFEEKKYDFQLESTIDEAVLIPEFKKAFETGQHHEISVDISSTNRAMGTIFGSEVTRRFGDSLKEDTFVINCKGGGGQSFGAFVPKGVTLRIEGDANDYLGKGLSGGKIVVVPPKRQTIKASENIIIGNVALYGATGGKVYLCGVAGERFCVRNSGATAVVEGCGDHGLEYMTGGRAVVLGPTGKNFAAGMSGGIAYVYDRDFSLYRRLNEGMVTMKPVSEKYDIAELKEILLDYEKETSSELAAEILEDFDGNIKYFKKIVANDYNRMLTAISKYEEQGVPHDKAVLEAFYETTQGK